MKTQNLTAAEWIYLLKPIQAWPHKFIAYTFLELLFLGALKLETRKAHYHGPRDPRVGGIMHYVDFGPHLDKFHYYRHQTLFLQHIKIHGESSLGDIMKSLRSRLGGENGSQIINHYIIPQLQDKGVLWSPYSVVHLCQIFISQLSRRKKLLRKSLESLDIYDLQQNSKHLILSDFGPLLLFDECKITQQAMGQKMSFKLQEKGVFYDFRVKEKEKDLEVFFPAFPIRNLMKICKKYFPPIYLEADVDFLS